MIKKSIAKNLVFNLIYQVLTILLPLVTTPYLSRVLGAEPIGIYGYTISIVTYFALFGTLGMSMYGQREIARLADDKGKYSKAFWEIILIRVITITISMLTFYCTFCIKGNYTLYYKILMLYLVANAFDINWLFQGVEEFSKTVIRNIIVKVLSIILIFTLVKSPSDLWIYILIYVASELLGNVSLWLYLPKYLQRVKLKELKLKKHIKPIGTLFLPQIATQIYTVLDKTMVGVITNNMSEVGYYEQAQKIARAALVIIASLQTVMNSRVANASAKKDDKEIVNCLEKSFNFVWLLGVPMTLGLIAVTSNLVPWYYGNNFGRVKPILMATSPIILAIGLNGITGIVYLIQTGQQKHYTNSVIIGAIINVIFNFILIDKFGGVGAAIASVIAEIAIFLYHLRFIKKVYNIKRIFNGSIKCIISGLIMFIVLMTLQSYFSASIKNTLILTITGAAIYLILLLILKYDFLYKIINQVIEGIIKHKRYVKDEK